MDHRFVGIRRLLWGAMVFLVFLSGCRSTEGSAFPDEAVLRVEVQPDRYIEHPVCSVALLTSLSDHVVYGEVVGREDVKTDLRTVSVVRIRIEEVFSGTLHAQEEICVEDTGYIGERLGDEAECTIWGEPLMREGHRVAVFLSAAQFISSEETRVSAFSLTEDELGKFFIDEQNCCHPAMRLSQAYREGRRIHHALEEWEPLSLEQLRDTVRAS